jgi:hypothetical protein
MKAGTKINQCAKEEIDSFGESIDDSICGWEGKDDNRNEE